jgi:hypothetical protein
MKRQRRTASPEEGPDMRLPGFVLEDEQLAERSRLFPFFSYANEEVSAQLIAPGTRVDPAESRSRRPAGNKSFADKRKADTPRRSTRSRR